MLKNNLKYYFFHKLKLFLFIYLFFNFNQGYSQNYFPHLEFTHIGVDEGLSQNTVYSIAQDSSGLMWFGNRKGLNKFDARSITIYKNISEDSTSLPGNTINSICVMASGQIWVATNNGLAVYNSNTDKFVQILADGNNKEGLISSATNCIFQDKYKNIWIGTRRGVCRLKSSNPYRFYQYLNDSENPFNIRNIYMDNNDFLWLATDKGLIKANFLNNQKTFKLFKYQNNSINQEINYIYKESDNLFWICTEKGGIHFFDPINEKYVEHPIHSKRLSKLSDLNIRKIIADRNGNKWIATISGLYILNNSNLIEVLNNPINPNSLSDNSVRELFIDKNNNIWIGTFFGGINIYDFQKKKFHNLQKLNKNINLNTIVTSSILINANGNSWIATEGSGIIILDKDKKSIQFLKHDATDKNSVSHNTIKCLLPDKNNGIWIGTMNGLDYLNTSTKKITHYNNQILDPKLFPENKIYSLAFDKKGNLLIGSFGGGLYILKSGEKEPQLFKLNGNKIPLLSSPNITFIKQTSDNSIWVGTSRGLNRIENDSKLTTFLYNPSIPNSYKGQHTLSIFEDSKNRLWFGTRDMGLNLYMNDKTFKNYSEKEGLNGNTVNAILEDEQGFLWLSTNQGISKFDPDKEKFINYDKKDGLVCTEFNFNSFYKDKIGNLYFGGYNGVVYFHPDSIPDNKRVPKIILSKLYLFNKEVNINDESELLSQNISKTDTIIFSYTQNVFSLQFSVLNFINPTKNKFAYRLKGFEKEYNYVKEPVAIYMNLPSGKYIFEAIGSNDDGLWSLKPLKLTIIVLPPPWKTWWAYLIYAIIVLLSLWAFIRFTKIRITLEQKLYLEQLENKKQNELYQMKLRFFTNISHELRTPLTLIIAPVNHLLDNFEIENEVRKQLALIQANANRLLALFNQLIDFRKQESGNIKIKVAEGNIIKFIKEIHLAFHQYAKIKKIELDFDADPEIIEVWYDRRELEKVFYNLLANAFKFTPENGKISIKIRKNFSQEHEKEYVTIIIEDNGCGIPPNDLKKIFDRFYQVENKKIADSGFGIGLALAKGIIDLHKGFILVESKEQADEIPGYTRFFVHLPLGNRHFKPAEIDSLHKTSEQIESFKELDSFSAFENEKTIIDEKTKKLKTFSILLVEDNIEIREFIKEQLSTHYRIREASNGVEGFELAVKSLPDIIISDVLMPEMDGIELTGKLKSDERTNHIPIILLTARASLVYEMEGLEKGADEYIIKPFNTKLLELKIKNLLISRRLLQEKFSKRITLEPQNTEIENPDEKFIKKILTLIEENISNPDFNVSFLVDRMNMSRPVIFRKVKSLTDLSVIDLIKKTKFKKASLLLKQKKLSISEVAYEVGFNDSKYFSKTFKAEFGKSPSEFMAEFS